MSPALGLAGGAGAGRYRGLFGRAGRWDVSLGELVTGAVRFVSRLMRYPGVIALPHHDVMVLGPGRKGDVPWVGALPGVAGGGPVALCPTAGGHGALAPRCGGDMRFGDGGERVVCAPGSAGDAEKML